MLLDLNTLVLLTGRPWPVINTRTHTKYCNPRCAWTPREYLALFAAAHRQLCDCKQSCDNIAIELYTVQT